MMKSFRISIKFLLAAVAAIGLTGCATVYKPLGWSISAYSKDEVVPYALSHPDVDVSVCGTGPGLTQLVGSFGRVVKHPHFTHFYTELLTGFCAEAEAYEANLRYLRADAQDNSAVAKDELMLSQRWHAIAAERRVRAVDALTARYGDLDSKSCPRLFTEADESMYLIGLVTALQAVRSDLLSGAQVGVPRDLAAKTMRAAECVSNNDWWGTPQAIESTVWAFVPGTKPDGKDTWANYQAAAKQAEKDGALLPLVLYALGADNQGEDDETRKALKLAAEIKSKNMDEFPEKYQLVNKISLAQLEFMSDSIWMELKGHRTPPQKLGSFPDESSARKADTEGLF